MSVLRTIESKLESLFEGVFGRAFRTNVQPVELARKLVKEMDDHRTVSVSRVYVPNEYTIYLSPADREQFADFEDSLRDELAGLPRRARAPRGLRAADAAAGEARDRRRPRRRRVRDRDADRARPDGRAGGRARRRRRPSPGATMVYKAGRRAGGDRGGRRRAELGVEREIAMLTWRRQRSTSSTKRRVVIGRSKDCDIQVDDPNVSRRHAEVRQEGATYWLVDLDSTNGVEVNGKRVQAAEARGRRRGSRSARPRSRFSRELA